MLFIWSRIISTGQASDGEFLYRHIVLRSFSLKFYKFTSVVLNAPLFWCGRGFFFIYITHFTTSITQNWLIAVFYWNCVRRGLYFWCIWHLIFIQILIVIGTNRNWAFLVKINIWRIPQRLINFNNISLLSKLLFVVVLLYLWRSSPWLLILSICISSTATKW